MKKIIFSIILSLILFLAYKIAFCNGIANNKQILKNIEVIVVLTGGKGRIAEGLKFINLSNIKYLIISGVNPAVSKQDILSNFKNSSYEKYFGKVIIENSSKNTIENAIETKKILEKKKIKKILIVTSCTHLFRASYIFNNIFKKQKFTIYYWKSKEDIKFFKIVKEIIKFIFDYLYLFFLTIFN